jgi:hypothetical protein
LEELLQGKALKSIGWLRVTHTHQNSIDGSVATPHEDKQNPLFDYFC